MKIITSNKIVEDGKVLYTATILNKKVAKCNVCEKTMLPTSIRSHLKRHEVYGEVLKKGSKMKNKPLRAECDTCGKKMPKKHLLAHFLIHDGIPGQLICKHCGKVFDRPNTLLRHCRAKHGYPKVDKCSYCDYMACSPYEVKMHEKTHKGGDALKCTICKKNFKLKKTWEFHMAEHEDPKIQCPKCPEKFHTPRKLTRHDLSEHVFNFQCPHCPLTSLYKSNIQTHIKKKHGKSKKKDIKKVFKRQVTKNTNTKVTNTEDYLSFNKQSNANEIPSDMIVKHTTVVLNSKNRVNENSILRKEVSPNATKENLETVNDQLIPSKADNSVQIIEVRNVENLDNQEVYTFDESSTVTVNLESVDIVNLENKDVFEDIEDLNSDSIHLNHRNEELNQDNEEFNQDNEKFNRDNEDFNEDNEDFNEDNEDLESSHENQNPDSENLHQSTKNINENIVDLPSDHEIFNDSYEVLHSDFEDLDLESEDLNVDNEDLNVDNEDLNVDNEDLNVDNEDLNPDNEHLNPDNEHLNPDNEHLNPHNAHLNPYNEDLNQDNEDLNQDNEHLNPYNEDLNQDNEVLKSKQILKEGRKVINTNTSSDIIENNQKNVIGEKDKPKYKRRKVQCSVCGLEMLSSSLPEHRRRHEVYGSDLKKRFKNYELKKRPRAQCDTCGKRMQKKHLLAHFLRHDLTNRDLICKHCGTTFKRPNRLLIHCRSKHGYEKVDKCSFCDFMGTSENAVKYHEIREHRGFDLFTCEICGKNFQTAVGLSRHSSKHEEPKIQCTKCTELFPSLKQRNLHMIRKHKKKLPKTIKYFQCPHCSYMTQNKRSIVMHMKKIHFETNIQDIVKVIKKPTADTTVKNKPSLKRIIFNRNPLSLDIMDPEEKQDVSQDIKQSGNFLSAFHKHLETDQANENLSQENVKTEELSKKLDTDSNVKVDNVNIDSNLNVVCEVLIADAGEFSGNGNIEKELSSDVNKENDENEIAGFDIDPKTGYGKCKLCGEWMQKRYLLQHVKWHDPKFVQTRLPKLDPRSGTVECDTCGMKVKKQRFKRHFLRHANPKWKPIICEHCGLRFERNSSLLSHCIARHGYEKTAQCSYCTYMSINAHQIKLHERIHTGEKPFSCNICQKKFRLPSTYKSHVATHDKTENTIECSICKKVMKKRTNAVHKKIHEPHYKPPPRRVFPRVECPVCGTSVQKNNLKEHMTSHDGSKRSIGCEHCDKVFDRQSRLLRHCKAIHGYEKTDQCSFCDYRGCTRAEVRLHESKHTGEKPYVCSICDATFRFPGCRLKHLAEKHGQGKPVQCEVCAETFLTARLLSSHKYEKHPKHTYSYECALCHNVYKRRGAARKHLLKNHNELRTIDKIIKVRSNPSVSVDKVRKNT